MQNYQNHRSYYTAHHFIFYPLTLILAGLSIRFSVIYPEHHFELVGLALSFALIGWLSYMMRQHYGLGNQDRIIRLEFRLRYFQLTGKTFDALEEQLTFPQITALRFASDGELLALIQEAIDKKLSSGEIKKSIKSWKPDYMRV
ncbi:MAG TPA: hypothetical protein DIT07_13685 [Sphingobacteriaceae bacterium]|nr:hypothetical protein [Sphingobacteriaceae bacterium]